MTSAHPLIRSSAHPPSRAGARMVKTIVRIEPRPDSDVAEAAETTHVIAKA